mgnify:CR=1 FL=1
MRAPVCLLLSLLASGLLFSVLMSAPAARSLGRGQQVVTIAVNVSSAPVASPVASPVTLRSPASRQDEQAAPAESRERLPPFVSSPQDAEANRDMPTISEGDDGGYLPASQLTERPQVLRDIVPDWTQPPMPQPVTGVLMINEFGDVDRVVLADAMLTPVQQDALRSQLAAARFAPGKLYGRPVKTALRIEIRLH